MKKLFILMLIVFSVSLYWCWSKKWDLFFYKDAWNIWDENTWIIMKDVWSLENCRFIAEWLLKEYENWDYECWSNCKPLAWDPLMSMCKETIR